MFARVEMARKPAGDKDAAGAALEVEPAGRGCYPADAWPRFLATQRAALVTVMPGKAEPLPESPATPIDAFYEGSSSPPPASRREALLKLMPFTDEHTRIISWPGTSAACATTRSASIRTRRRPSPCARPCGRISPGRTSAAASPACAWAGPSRPRPTSPGPWSGGRTGPTPMLNRAAGPRSQERLQGSRSRPDGGTGPAGCPDAGVLPAARASARRRRQGRGRGRRGRRAARSSRGT